MITFVKHPDSSIRLVKFKTGFRLKKRCWHQRLWAWWRWRRLRQSGRLDKILTSAVSAISAV